METNTNTEVEMREIFSERLRRLREDRGLGLQELTDILFREYKIKIISTSLNNYENYGFRVPSLYNLTKIAEYFDVTIDYLLGRTDIKNAVIQQVNLFDNENKPHIIEVAMDKNIPLKERPFEEIMDLIKQLKELGFDFHI